MPNRGLRWTIGAIAVVALGLAIVWVLFVPAADWLARHDVGSVTGTLHETAVDNARGRLLTLGAGLFAVGALVFTARNFTLSREGQVSDRYTKAVEQLGSETLDVRIGGIYALERIAHDSARDHPTVMEVLTAFIREHSRERWPLSEPGGTEPEQMTRPDVQAALTVVGRRNAKRDIRPVDLSGSDLRRADLSGLNLRGADLSRVNLADARLASTGLARAILHGADLRGAYLTTADLDGANLRQANLRKVDLRFADLSGAHGRSAVNFSEADLHGIDLNFARLRGVHLINADLGEADLRGADLRDAHLYGASLAGADLSGADLRGAQVRTIATDGADFTGAGLARVKWTADVPVPAGWKLNTDLGVLEPKDAGSPPAEAG